jgi:hypothetical protein
MKDFMDWWGETMMDKTLTGFTLLVASSLILLFVIGILTIAIAVMMIGTWQPMALIVIAMVLYIAVQYRKR